jgi:hypothetical protein
MRALPLDPILVVALGCLTSGAVLLLGTLI